MMYWCGCKVWELVISPGHFGSHWWHPRSRQWAHPPSARPPRGRTRAPGTSRWPWTGTRWRRPTPERAAGRMGGRASRSSCHLHMFIDIRCILCCVDMSTYPQGSTLTIDHQSNTSYRQWFSCLHTSCPHAPVSAGRSRPSPWRCSALAWSLSLWGTSPSTDTAWWGASTDTAFNCVDESLLTVPIQPGAAPHHRRRWNVRCVLRNSNFLTLIQDERVGWWWSEFLMCFMGPI